MSRQSLEFKLRRNYFRDLTRETLVQIAIKHNIVPPAGGWDECPPQDIASYIAKIKAIPEDAERALDGTTDNPDEEDKGYLL